MRNGQNQTLPEYLTNAVFGKTDASIIYPDATDKKGADAFENNFKQGLPIERTASTFLS